MSSRSARRNRKKKELRKLKKSEVFSSIYDRPVEFEITKLDKYNENGETIQRVIDDIVINFRSESFLPIRVGELPSGQRKIIDGHHRTCAAEELGMKVIKGFLEKVESDAEIARLYLHYNDVRLKSALEKHRGRIASGEAADMKLQEAASTYKFKFGRSRSDDTISSIPTLMNSEKKYGIPIIETGFRVLRDSFAGKKEVLQATMLRALFYFLFHAKDHENFDIERFIKVLSRQNMLELVQAFKVTTRTPESVGVEKFLQIYNYRLSDKLELNVVLK